MKKCYIIDDEPGSSYIENVIMLMNGKDYEVIVISDIDKARKAIPQIMLSEFVILDLMMPETNKSRKHPADICEVGLGLCYELINNCFTGKIAIITNAKPERHSNQIGPLSLLCKTNEKISLTYKYKVKSIAFVDNLTS